MQVIYFKKVIPDLRRSILVEINPVDYDFVSFPVTILRNTVISPNLKKITPWSSYNILVASLTEFNGLGDNFNHRSGSIKINSVHLTRAHDSIKNAIFIVIETIVVLLSTFVGDDPCPATVAYPGEGELVARLMHEHGSAVASLSGVTGEFNLHV